MADYTQYPWFVQSATRASADNTLRFVFFYEEFFFFFVCVLFVVLDHYHYHHSILLLFVCSIHVFFFVPFSFNVDWIHD